MGRQPLMRQTCGRWLFLLLLVAAGWLAGGCRHTQPTVSLATFQTQHKQYQIGVEGVYDTNQFNYADTVAKTIVDAGCFSSTVLTHDLRDAACDYVIRGNFSFYKVRTYNGFHYASIYLFLTPQVTGLPYARVDGTILANFEVYHGGKLLKTYEYRDVFRWERGLYTWYPTPSADSELNRVTRLLLRDMMHDFFALKGKT